MSNKTSFQKDRVSDLLENDFVTAEPIEETLRFSGYEETYRAVADPVRAYVQAIMADDKENPLFQFCSTKDFANLSEGEEKWLGFIPWMLNEANTRTNTETTAQRLVAEEMERLNLDPSCLTKLQNLIRNGLISILHDNIKQAKDIKVMSPKFTIGSSRPGKDISYQQIRNAVAESKSEAHSKDEDPLPLLLEKIGFLKPNTAASIKEKIIGQIERTKLEAVSLYKDLGTAIMEGQKEAGIKGDLATIDLRIEDTWETYFYLLKKAFGLNGSVSEGCKDEYEAQAVAHLTYLLLKLRSHPTMKVCQQFSPIINKKFINDFYQKIGATPENKRAKKVGVQKDGSLASDIEDVHNYVPLDCYQTTLEGFDDLDPEKKEIVRGGFRLKDEISILIKTLIKKQMLKDITDIDAGECVAINISENDLENSPNKDRLADFMEGLAREAAVSFGPNLVEAAENIPYGKLARGTFKIENKLKKDPKNTESFNFPAVKCYANIPIEDPTNPEASIRVEFRVLCGDTHLRGTYDENSRSHHSHYKRKQSIKLLRIITPRAHKAQAQIHEVAKEHKKWSKRQEKAENEAVRERRRTGKDKFIIVPQNTAA